MKAERVALGRFLNAVANLKLTFGLPDSLDHVGAKVFYHRVITGLLRPACSARGSPSGTSRA
jgi:hypothetical protein